MRATTYRPNKRRAKKKHGWRERMSTHNGSKVIRRRKNKGRRKLAK